MEGADITMRRPIQINSDYVFSVAPDWILARAKLQYGLDPDQVLRIRLIAIPPQFTEVDDVLSLWIGKKEKGKKVFKPIPRATATLHVGPGPAERLGIYAHPMPGLDRKVRTVIAAEDRFGNPGRFDPPIDLQLEWEGKIRTVTVETTRVIDLDEPKGIARLKAIVPVRSLGTKNNITNGLRQAESYLVTGNPVWARSPHGKTAAFGEFHWHTELSGDGGCPLTLGLRSARDHLNMNYCFPSDHIPSPEKWAYTVKIVNQFNAPDKFVTVFGWENSTSQGHDNYYFTDPNHPVKAFGQAAAEYKKPFEIQDRLATLQDSLDQDDKFIAVPHHTNAVSETYQKDGTPYWHPYTFTRGDNFHRLIEVFQTRGNMERNEYTDAWRGWYHFGSSVQDALAKGYKVGFTGGSDNHVSRPGRSTAALEAYGRIPPSTQALTGTWTDRIERQSIWQALYDRHTWAVWDTRALVYFTINDAQAGEKIVVDSSTALSARIKMSAEDSLQSLEIVSEGKTVWINSIDELDFDISVDLGQAKQSTHFYLRALQRNGGIIYASPVFVEVNP